MPPFCAAIASSKGPKNGKLYTEDDWNETATLEESPYLLSKVRSYNPTSWFRAANSACQYMVTLPYHVRLSSPAADARSNCAESTRQREGAVNAFIAMCLRLLVLRPAV